MGRRLWGEEPHKFKQITGATGARCVLCQGFLFTLASARAVGCSVCGLVCHEKCAPGVPKTCPGHSSGRVFNSSCPTTLGIATSITSTGNNPVSYLSNHLPGQPVQPQAQIYSRSSMQTGTGLTSRSLLPGRLELVPEVPMTLPAYGDSVNGVMSTRLVRRVTPSWIEVPNEATSIGQTRTAVEIENGDAPPRPHLIVARQTGIHIPQASSPALKRMADLPSPGGVCQSLVPDLDTWSQDLSNIRHSPSNGTNVLPIHSRASPPLRTASSAIEVCPTDVLVSPVGLSPTPLSVGITWSQSGFGSRQTSSPVTTAPSHVITHSPAAVFGTDRVPGSRSNPVPANLQSVAFYGYLRKQSHRRMLQQWKRRFFVLDTCRHQLRYYDTELDEVPRDIIDLQEVRSVRLVRQVPPTKSRLPDSPIFEVITFLIFSSAFILFHIS
ncbi:unnamed protein product [Protopolystoma xenopodis]|uniref:Phorbol-ester/DAG-type domain-containing protein n=1 Tax=Protopolystoma xenopodis TaxID=117903 RepID=A0A448WA26_9PLAT|nr:unnamed protein product [Protopolystoma xenopodis]